jgi:hypothetical protein
VAVVQVEPQQVIHLEEEEELAVLFPHPLLQ